MRILVLCDNFIQVKRFNQELENSFKVDYLICNNKKENSIKFLIKQSLYILKSKSILEFIKLFITNKIKYVFTKLNDNYTINLILYKNYDIGLHSMGVIYSSDIINVFNLGILNSHIGILPKYRGRSVMEWSILQGDKIGITCFFIDSGIDTGKRILVKKEYSINDFKTIFDAKQFLFLQDVNMYKLALQYIQDNKNKFIVNDISKGKRYYVMSNFFLNALEEWMENNG